MALSATAIPGEATKLPLSGKPSMKIKKGQ